MFRKETYLKWINESIPKLEGFQNQEKNYKGCFFYPYWQKKTTYVNARWQEASFTFGWLYSRTGNETYKQHALDGVDYWCRLQKASGAFPEYSRFDTSFSATVFSTLTMAYLAEKIPLTKTHYTSLLKAADWICKNDELVYTNQEAVAAATLLQIYYLTKNKRYFQAAQRKLDLVLKNQSPEGYYNEKGGFDLGYSSLTLEMLGHYYLRTQDRKILRSAEKFLQLVLSNNHRENVRGTTWVLTDGFEIFAENAKNGREALKKVLENYNTKHLEQDINLCTDLYRHCWAHDHVTVPLKHKKIKEIIVAMPQLRRSKLLNILRPLGLHRLRKVFP